MSEKGYQINMRGNVARMESPTDVVNPFDEKTTEWKFDHDILTMMWLARCPTCKKIFTLGETPGGSYLLHLDILEGRKNLACINEGDEHWEISRQDHNFGEFRKVEPV